jgi:uncharacterized membrane protein SpoIIM required for sporulation
MIGNKRRKRPSALDLDHALVRSGRERWGELEGLLTQKPRLADLRGPQISRFGALFRTACRDLMRARAARGAQPIAEYLDLLVARAHARLYGPTPFAIEPLLRLLGAEFPAAVRRHAGAFTLAWLLLILPSCLALWATLKDPSFALSVVPEDQLRPLAESYSAGFDAGRASAEGTAMAGFYVHNNVGIAFRCFATGVFLGLGSVFFLAYNGVVFGAVIGYVHQVGAGEQILTFICGHGPWELTAIAISGAAGLELGRALVDRRGLSVGASLRAHAPDLVRLISGAALYLLIAAGIEAFWSPSALPAQLKWGVGGVMALLVTLHLALGGRRRAPHAAPSSAVGAQ